MSGGGSKDMLDFEFSKNMQDIDLLSDWTSAGQAGDETANITSNSNAAAAIGADSNSSQADHQLAVSSDSGLLAEQAANQDFSQMILEEDGVQTTFHPDPDATGNELVVDTLGSDIVFENVGNEVSIQAATPPDQQPKASSTQVRNIAPKALQSKPQPQARPRPVLPAANRVTKPASGKPQPIIIPVGNNNQAGASLAQFITQIRPPAIPGGSSNLQKTKVVPIKAISIPPKKPTAIAPAPATSNVKLIMTQTGQQLVISPLKTEQAAPGKFITASTSGTTLTTATGQQVFMLSPVKSGVPQKLVQVLPKPKPPQTSGTTQTVRIQSIQSASSLTSQAQIIKSVSSSADVKPVQVKVVTVPSANTQLKVTGNLRPIAPSPVSKTGQTATTIASSIATLGTGQKLITIPKGNVLQAANVVGGTANNAIITGTGGAQVIMLPANILQGGNAQVAYECILP